MSNIGRKRRKAPFWKPVYLTEGIFKFQQKGSLPFVHGKKHESKTDSKHTYEMDQAKTVKRFPGFSGHPGYKSCKIYFPGNTRFVGQKFTNSFFGLSVLRRFSPGPWLPNLCVQSVPSRIPHCPWFSCFSELVEASVCYDPGLLVFLLFPQKNPLSYKAETKNVSEGIFPKGGFYRRKNYKIGRLSIFCAVCIAGGMIGHFKFPRIKHFLRAGQCPVWFVAFPFFRHGNHPFR